MAYEGKNAKTLVRLPTIEDDIASVHGMGVADQCRALIRASDLPVDDRFVWGAALAVVLQFRDTINPQLRREINNSD
jgi:hypothetical protein